MTTALQVSGTDVKFRFKATLKHRLEGLRGELQRLAAHAHTRPVFKCGYYEIVTVVVDAVEDIKQAFVHDNTMKKACVRIVWLALRPKISEQRFLKVLDEPWGSGLIVGTHRLRASWCQQRLDHLDDKRWP